MSDEVVMKMKELSPSIEMEREPLAGERKKEIGPCWQRWPILIVVFNCVFLNSFLWISFSPVANHTNKNYGTGSATWFSLFFLITALVAGLAGLNAGELVGHSTSLLSACVLNSLACALRIFATWWQLTPLDAHHRYMLVAVGQAVAGCGYPFLMYLPSKTSRQWFPAEERTLATTVGVMAGPAAVLFANLLVPRLVSSTDDFWYLDLVLLFGIISQTPAIWAYCMKDQPEAEMTGTQTMSYGRSIKECFTNKNYILTLIVLSGGIGLFNCLYTVMQEMLCPVGYSNTTVGYCAVAMITAGILGSVVVSLFVDRNSSHQLVLRLSILLAVVFGICFLAFTHISNMPVPLVIVAGLFGFTGLASYPVGLEIATEAAFPAATNVISGSIVLCGQAFCVVFVMLIRYFAKPFAEGEIVFENQSCQLDPTDTNNMPKDYQISTIVIAIVSICLVPLAMFINVEYKRRAAENEAKIAPNCGKVLPK